MDRYFFVFLFLLGLVPTLSLSTSCRCLYGDQCFPKIATWRAFNKSVGGRLIAPHPPAYACHDPHYDEEVCNVTKTLWVNGYWRSDQVGALELPQFEAYGNESCYIDSSRETPCDQGSVPVYAVNVSSVSHIKSTVKFARHHNLRLVIKNTGHDYIGRSTGRGALSLWMHNLKDITFLQYHSCGLSGQSRSAVKVGAGVQFRELYEAATNQNVVVVGAMSYSVGAAGGWFQGAGHSSLSPSFGLGADNVLEIELVTAFGEHIIANDCVNKDLFWAMRGGGPGSYGVVVSVTYATHPAPKNVLTTTIFVNSTDSSSFQEFLSEFAALHPTITDNGWAGTFRVSPSSILVNYLALEKDISYLNATFQPLWDFIELRPSLYVNIDTIIRPDYKTWVEHILCLFYGNLKDDGQCVDRVGENRLVGSRLIPRQNLEENPKQIGEMLIDVVNAPRLNPWILGLSVAGGAVSKVDVHSNAVNPAWRRAIWHLVIGLDGQDSESPEEKEKDAKAVTAATAIMKNITPGSGAYINEADTNEADWQYSLYGEKYLALKAIKDARDPTGLFVCRHCVGSEEWTDDFKCPI